MSYQIIEQYETVSGKWQVRVAIDATTSAFFNYPTPPAQAQVDIDAESYALQMRLSQLQNTNVEAVQPEQKTSVISKLEYMDRFTDVELAGIYAAAKVYPQVEVWLEKFKLAENVNTQDPRVLAGLQALEGAGLLVVGRAAEIIA